jgi:tetratricopeptide (TPR) repeat protein
VPFGYGSCPIIDAKMSERADQILTYVVLALAFGYIAFRTIKRAEDPARTAFKWVLTLVIVGFIRLKVFPMADAGGMAAFSAVSLCMVSGLVLFITWRMELGAIVAKPFASLYDGGDVQIEPHPFYSIARARQKQGKYEEAIADIRKQLERFPTDVEGQMLLAEIQAQDLKDLAATETTIQEFCAQPGHAPTNIAFALYSLADWHLKYAQDRQAARRALEQVIALLPDTEFALAAAQRIGHLANPDMPLAQAEARKFVVTEGVRNLGLARGPQTFAPKEKDPAKMAAEYVQHLEQHPLDTDVRERLAVLYADHYHRLDLAAGELEQMIAVPNQPAKNMVRWLNLLADLQIRDGADYEEVKQTLQRIVDIDPNLAAAETARKRIALLKLELKGKQQNQSVKLGTYEQNIGLKRGRAPIIPPD